MYSDQTQATVQGKKKLLGVLTKEKARNKQKNKR
jgi:hypothetical protein